MSSIYKIIYYVIIFVLFYHLNLLNMSMYKEICSLLSLPALFFLMFVIGQRYEINFLFKPTQTPIWITILTFVALYIIAAVVLESSMPYYVKYMN